MFGKALALIMTCVILYIMLRTSTCVCFPLDHYRSTETWIPLVVLRMTEPVSNNGNSVPRDGSLMRCDFSLSLFLFSSSGHAALAAPNSLHVNPPGGGGGSGVSSSHHKRRTLVAPQMNLSLDQSEGSLLSDDFLDTPDDLDINVDDIDTPDETDSLEFITNGNDLEWEGQGLNNSHMCLPPLSLKQ